MDVDMVFETLDSLWFFSNILSNPTQPHPNTQPLLSPNLEESPTALIVGPVEEETREAEVSVMCRNDEPKMEQRRRKKKKKSKRTDKFIHEEEEEEEIEEAKKLMCVISALVKNQLKSCYYSSSYRVREVRGDDDGDDLGIDMMKEHLKSWAHAVACTVK